MCGLGEMGIHRGLKGGGWIRYSALVWNTAVEITLWGVCGVGEDDVWSVERKTNPKSSRLSDGIKHRTSGQWP